MSPQLVRQVYVAANSAFRPPFNFTVGWDWRLPTKSTQPTSKHINKVKADGDGTLQCNAAAGFWSTV